MILLDTHVWLWSLLEPGRLSRQVQVVMAMPESVPALSPISVWETLLLAQKGRLALGTSPWDFVRRALSVQPLRHLPLTPEIAIASRIIRMSGEDPADRFIAATAMVHGIALATADRDLLACSDIRTVRAG